MWIQCEGQVDSIKFSSFETKVLLSAYKNQPNYQRIIDSCESQIKEYKGIIKNDSVDKSAANKLNKTKDILIQANKEEKEDLEKRLKFADRWRKFWKGATGVSLAGAGIYSIYKEIKP